MLASGCLPLHRFLTPCYSPAVYPCTDWQKDGLVGGMTFLQYIALGNANPVDFEQKRVTGVSEGAGGEE